MIDLSDLEEIETKGNQPKMWVGTFDEDGKKVERLVVAGRSTDNPTLRQRICRIDATDMEELTRLRQEKNEGWKTYPNVHLWNQRERRIDQEMSHIIEKYGVSLDDVKFHLGDYPYPAWDGYFLLPSKK